MRLLAAIQSQPTAGKTALSRSTGHCPRTVARWSTRVASGDLSLEDAARSGRPRKLSAKDIQKAVRHLRSARSPTIASALRLVNRDRAAEDQISEKTLRRHMKGQPVRYAEPVRQAVSAANAVKRKAATTQPAINKIRSSLKRLVFLDAALVSWGPGKGIVPYRRGKEWGDPEHPRKQDLSSTTLYHFYSAVTLGPQGHVHRHELIFVPPKKGFTAQRFVEDVAKPVLRWAKGEVFPDGEFFVVQDQAKQHTAKHAVEWMDSAGYKLYDHPPQSPDLNRIEKVWAVFKARLVGKHPRTEKRFKKVMRVEWDKVRSSDIAKIIEELPSVMKKVHSRPGQHVKE